MGEGATGPFPTLGWLGSLASQTLGGNTLQHGLVPISKSMKVNLWDEGDDQFSQVLGFISLPGQLWGARLYTHTRTPTSVAEKLDHGSSFPPRKERHFVF